MPKQPEPSWHDGLRGLRAEEFDSLRQLLETVFWPGIVEKYPHCYNLGNAENLRVVVEDGRVISHVGAIQRNFTIFGCTVRVASLGGVATYPEHRAKGHATRLFEDNLRKFRADGVDFALVSGYRKMYHRFGCRYVGKDWRFTLSAQSAAALDEPALDLVAATPEDAALLAEIYRREPVRWLRPVADYRLAMAGYVMNRPAKFFLVREGQAPRGYLILLRSRRDPSEPRGEIGEFAGERKAIVGCLGKLVAREGLGELSLHVSGWDGPTRELLCARGLAPSPANSSGTVMIVNFVQFMERMRPYFEELLGLREARGLVFAQDGGRMVFAYGADQVVAQNAGEAAQVIFGTLEGAEERLLREGGRAGEVLRKIFPLPAPWYGINYV